MIIRKTPAGKDFRIYGSLKDGNKVLGIMKRCFKKRELPIAIELNLNKNCPDHLYGCNTLYHTLDTETGKRWKYCEILLPDINADLTIVHELEHIVRYCKYGFKDPRCRDEDSVTSAALRRLKKS